MNIISICIYGGTIIYQQFFVSLRRTKTENVMNSDVVTLATFSSAAEANIVASMLMSMGIEVQVVNEISTTVVTYVNDNVVRILVGKENYELARKIIATRCEGQE